MCSASHFALYYEKFLDRPILSCVDINPCDFTLFDLNPGSFITSLGWGSLVLDRRYFYFLDAVRQFYANLKIDGSSLLAGVFNTYVDGHRLFITPKLLAAHGNPRCTGALPFAPEITVLLSSLGIRLHHKYLSLSPFDAPKPIIILLSIGCRRVKGSWRDIFMNVDDLIEDVQYDLALSDDCMPRFLFLLPLSINSVLCLSVFVRV
ncbi:hypothetical protein LINGRAPRIM_LOCUS2706 [Linum grandiflorum]